MNRKVGPMSKTPAKAHETEGKPAEAALERLAYRPREVAQMVGMSESGVRNLIKRGSLRAVRWDGSWLIPADAVKEKLDAPATDESTAPVHRAEVATVPA